jgi:hypothetical protein
MAQGALGNVTAGKNALAKGNPTTAIGGLLGNKKK